MCSDLKDSVGYLTYLNAEISDPFLIFWHFSPTTSKSIIELQGSNLQSLQFMIFHI